MTASVDNSRVWLITGASRGLGRALAEAVLEDGGRVLVTARETDTIAELPRSYPGWAATTALDVTDPAAADAAVDRAIDEFGRLDVVVNNAGYGLLGALEELSDGELRSQFETNLFGTLNVTRAVLPRMRGQRSGHIVQISSLSGVAPNPGESAYAGTKAAVEAISQSLAQEAGHLGIKVTIVEPGPVRTEFAGPSLARANPIEDYSESVGRVRELLGELDGNQPNDPALAARAIIRAVQEDKPPLRLPLGEQAFAGIRQHLQELAEELDRTEPLAAATALAGN
jgi:NAD(P)-dependent dehydrogenase (short-subunit alcohol dehydrogenase family)